MDVSKIKNELLNQKKSKFKGNIYHFFQVNFAYNSNKIEGSKLTKNHFKLFDFILDNIYKPLTKSMIIKMNTILKRGTTDEDNPRYNIGGFKILPNIIGTVNFIKTSPPEETEKQLDKLLEKYSKLKKVTLEDILDFHVSFEKIHPFADENGRTGRIIMFKECLKNNIMPFIILDEYKSYYLRGLKEYDNDKAFLTDTCKHAQDIYENICNKLLDFEINDK